MFFSLSLRETTAWMQEVEQRRERLPRAGVRAKQCKNDPHPILLPRGEGTQCVARMECNGIRESMTILAVFPRITLSLHAGYVL
jgi:hypothetical protein